MKKNKTLSIKLNNKGFTMMEIIVTVAIVSIFFATISVVLPQSLEYYVIMEKTGTALELSDIISNGLEMELAGAASFAFSDEKGVTYIKNNELRSFPANKDVSTLNMNVSVDDRQLTVSGKPYVWGSVYDDEVYGAYEAEVKLKQNIETGDMRIELTIFDDEGQKLCSSLKPVIMYN